MIKRVFFASQIVLLGVVAFANPKSATNSEYNAVNIWFQQLTNASNASQYRSVTNWGATNCECELSIDLERNTVAPSSVVMLRLWINNASASHIALVREPIVLRLATTSESVYSIKPSEIINAPRLSRDDANPGEFIVKEVPVIFPSDMVSGEYKIYPLTRQITFKDGKTCALASNPLKVKVTKATDVFAEEWGMVTNHMQVSISLKNKQVESSESVIVLLKLKNTSTNETFHFTSVGPHELSFSYAINSPSGLELKKRDDLTFSGSIGPRPIYPGETAEFDLNLSWLYHFDEAGKYKMAANVVMISSDKAREFVVYSNPLNFTVLSK